MCWEFWKLSTRKALIKAETLSQMQLMNDYCFQNLCYAFYLLLDSIIYNSGHGVAVGRRAA